MNKTVRTLVLSAVATLRLFRCLPTRWVRIPVLRSPAQFRLETMRASFLLSPDSEIVQNSPARQE